MHKLREAIGELQGLFVDDARLAGLTAAWIAAIGLLRAGLAGPSAWFWPLLFVAGLIVILAESVRRGAGRGRRPDTGGGASPPRP